MTLNNKDQLKTCYKHYIGCFPCVTYVMVTLKSPPKFGARIRLNPKKVLQKKKKLCQTKTLGLLKNDF